MVGKPKGRKPLTPTERQRRWRSKKRRIATGAEKRGRRELRLAAMAIRTEQARIALNSMAPIYNVIYADTPPKFENWSDQTGMDRAAENHYETMLPALIEAMGNAVPAAPDCVLYLWSTVPMLPAMLAVMAEWGFRYSSHVVWIKTTFSKDKLKFGLGHETRNAHELLLIGKKGSPPAAIRGEQFPSVIFAPRGPHSEKPSVFAETIERMFPDAPKLEMFAREPRVGWDCGAMK